MSITRADDVSHVRFRAPDLAAMNEFLDDFGMVDAARDEMRLFMRGHGPAPFVHATERGEPGFAAFGICVTNRAALQALVEHDGATIQPFDAPGGGEVVRLIDPDGFVVEVVYGQTQVPPLATPSTMPWNEKGDQRRQGAFRRVAKGPSHVLRLGHVVLSVSNFRASEAWYKERFGLLTSDEIQPVPGVAIGAFLRADRGDDRTSDHHTLFLLEHPTGPGFLHAAFEVVDVDDLMAGRDHLLARSRSSVWGIGRHLLGSQIFDYWTDPWGHEVEHWTDGDQLKASDGGNIATLDQLMGVQWGMAFPGPPEEEPVA